MRHRGTRIFFGGTVTVIALVAAIWGGSSASGSETKSASTIKIGFFAPESGFAAADGASAYDAAKLAVAQINASGGVGGAQIQLVNYDDGSDAKQAVAIATKLVTKDHVTAVVSGSYSDQTLAAASIFQRNSVPMLAAYAVNPGIPSTGKYVFQQDFSGAVEGAAGAVALVKMKHVKKVAIVAIDNDFGHALVDGFKARAKKLGATIVHTDFNDFGEKQFTPVITGDVSRGATGFYVVQYAAEGLQFVRNWKTANEKLPVVSTEGIDSTTQFIAQVGTGANGFVITTALNRDSKSPATKRFLSAFKAKYHFAPDMVGATTYDSFFVLRKAMAGGTSSSSIASRLAALKNYLGVTGKIFRYTSKRSPVKPVDLEVFKGNRLRHYGTISDRSVITPK
jgi:branched-chain amino acid transport system substrate-binding protein